MMNKACSLDVLNDVTWHDACRGESLHLQSQLADTQEEAQLLRRLLTLCNQALNAAALDTQPVLPAVEEEQETVQQHRPTQELRAADTAKVCAVI